MIELKYLTAGQRSALFRLDRGVWFRQRGSYTCPGVPAISFKLVADLVRLGLAEPKIAGRAVRLNLTPSGRILAGQINSAKAKSA